MMKVSKILISFILIGIGSLVAIIYFYFIQRDFTQQHRKFIISINNLENRYSDITNLVLKNSLYIYVNQDNIAKANKKLEENYENLKNSKILLHKNYADIKKKVSALKKDLDENKKNVDYFLRINANIKNSLLFLSRHIDDSAILNKYDKKELLKARIILKHLNDVKRLQDLDYIKKEDYLLSSNSTNKDVQNYIKSFNIHSKFLVKEYPIFLSVTKKILGYDLNELKIHKIKEEFSAIAMKDFDALDRFAFVLLFMFLISFATIITLLLKYQHENKKLQETYSSLEYSLTYDQLTNLFNRRKFELDIEKTIKPTLLLININGFKYINDIYGNSVGNILLKYLTKFIKYEISFYEKVSLYRLGGDEFGIIFNDIASEKSLEIATKLEKDISNHIFKIKKIDLEISVSIAINSIKPILENADLILKQIKKSNTDGVAIYDGSQHLKQNVKENMKIVKTIKEALKEDRIAPYYQPIVNLQNSKIEKYEALVRLTLKDGTILPPFKFLDIAQKSSQYNEITKIVIEKTIKTSKKYPQYRFSLNMSMRDISNKEIRDILFDALEKNKDAKIDIELLESEYLEDMKVVKDFITKLHTFDSKILIDDFGTGYSNFSYFSELDIDLVKIDGSIVKEITTDKRMFHMLKSIKEFANGMNMITVSEFVESREIALKLKDIGAVYAQGYYFSEPLEQPLDDENVII